MFNSLKCVKKLEEVGVSRVQAETHVQIMGDLIESNFVTSQEFREEASSLKSEMMGFRHELKSEMDGLRHELKSEMDGLRHELRSEMDGLRHELKSEMDGLRHEFKSEMAGFRHEFKTEIADLRNEIKQSEYRMTIKLGTIVSLAMGILVAINKLL